MIFATFHTFSLASNFEQVSYKSCIHIKVQFTVLGFLLSKLKSNKSYFMTSASYARCKFQRNMSLTTYLIS